MNDYPEYRVTSAQLTTIKHGDKYIAEIITLKNGYKLKLINEGEEVGGGFFPVITDEIADAEAAWDDAESTGWEWLNSREAEAESEGEE